MESDYAASFRSCTHHVLMDSMGCNKGSIPGSPPEIGVGRAANVLNPRRFVPVDYVYVTGQTPPGVDPWSIQQSFFF